MAQLRDALHATLAEAPHLHGVVLSSGPAVCLGATDPLEHDADAAVEDSIGIRRLLAPHLVRESFIVPLRDEGIELASVWAKAYSSEPAWLDQDLASLDLPALADCWRD